MLPLFLASALAGCAFPASGPRGADINAQATTTFALAEEAEAKRFVLLDVGARTEAGIPDTAIASIHRRLGASGLRARAARLTFSRGDIVQATIFESQAGGLFVDAAAGVRPGNFVQVPAQTVDASGSIKIPYAGNIRVVGRSAESVQAEIESKLRDKAIQPQVFVTTTSQRGDEVSVLGDVNTASKFALNPSGERILDVISRAGGIKSPGYETYVTLQRRGASVSVPFDTLVRSPEENVYIQPGDVVYVARHPRSYTVLGATGVQNRVPFPDERVVLSEAIGTGGGLADERAEPAYVYLYRVEPRRLLERLGVDLSGFNPTMSAIPTIYKADLRQPATLFAVRKFQIRDKDIIYIANADTVEVGKFFLLVNLITRPAQNVGSTVFFGSRLND